MRWLTFLIVLLCARPALADIAFTDIGPYGGTLFFLTDTLGGAWPPGLSNAASPEVSVQGTNPTFFDLSLKATSGHGCIPAPLVCGSATASMQLAGLAGALSGIIVTAQAGANATSDPPGFASAASALSGQINRIWVGK